MAPPNQTRLTAIDMSGLLPYTQVVDTANPGNPPFEIWYKYTAVTGDDVIGFQANISTTFYLAYVKVFKDADVLPFLNINTEDFGSTWSPPIEVPVTAGSTYYFRVYPSGFDNPAVANVTVNAQKAPNLSVPIGTITINDDQPGFSLAFIKTDGTALHYINNFPSSPNQRQVEQLPSGKILVVGATDPNNPNTFALYIYDDKFNLLFTPTISFAVNSGTLVSSDRNNTFYVLTLTSAIGKTYKLTTIDPTTGLQGATTWTITLAGNTVTLLGIKTDNTIAYLIQSLTNQVVKRYDLIGSAFTTNLVAGRANYLAHDMMVLKDDTIIVGYQKPSVTKDSDVKAYDTSGTTLFTHDFTSAEILDGFAYDPPTDPVSFWARLYQTFPATKNYNGFSNFYRLRSSDGLILETRGTTTDFQLGILTASLPAGPYNRFGPSFSCPFWLTTAALASTGAISSPTPQVTAVNTSNMQPGGGTVSGASLFGGIYYIKPNKTNDTIYTGMTSSTGGTTSGTGGTSSFYGATAIVAIPNPFVVL